MTRLALAAISFYQVVGRAVLPRSCRFFPSCSDYARQAVESRGLWRGLALTAARVARCHPLHPGGFDPVEKTIHG